MSLDSKVQAALAALISALKRSPDADRACNAVDIVYPQVAAVLTDQDQIDELTFQIVRALVEKGAV